MDINKIEVVVGTYEQFLLGYNLTESTEKTYTLAQCFAMHSHSASVRSISHGGRFLASGSADETIALYDMRERREHAPLNHCKSTVNCVKFTSDGTHLLIGCNDGSMNIFRAGNWVCEKTFTNAHKESIIDMALHPSDKFAFSISTDGTMKTWNLVKGRSAYTINLGRKRCSTLINVIFSDDGTYYVLVGGLEVSIYQLETAKKIKTVEVESRVASTCFYEHILLVGCDNGQIMVISLEEEDEIKNIQAHSSRVRCLKVFSTNTNISYLVSCSSNGEINLWKIKPCKINHVKVKELCSVNTGCRITSLDVLESQANTNVKEESTQDEHSNKTTTNQSQSSDIKTPKRKKRKKGQE